MDLSLHKIFLVMVLAECCVGVTLHVFIVAYQFVNWKTLKAQKTYNIILTYLAISRSLLIMHMSLFYVLRSYFPWVFINIMLRSAFLVIVNFLHYTNFWITTLLFAFCCLKITSYNHKIFIYMKARISKLVHHFTAACVLVSFAFSLSFGWCVFHFPQQISVNVSMTNMTEHNVRYEENAQNKLILLLSGSFPPLFISCVAIYLLIRSLWHHTREMKSSKKGYQNPNTEAHVTAIRSMTIFLFCAVLYFVCMGLLFSDVIDDSNPWKMLNPVIIFSLPSLHSAFIISSSFKLKLTFPEMCLSFIRCKK